MNAKTLERHPLVVVPSALLATHGSLWVTLGVMQVLPAGVSTVAWPFTPENVDQNGATNFTTKINACSQLQKKKTQITHLKTLINRKRK